MERGLFIAASGMLADQVRQDVIANNLANSTTPGYKGDHAVEQAFPSMLLHEIGSGHTIGSLGLGVQVAGVFTDPSQGSLRNTGNQLDLAIAGDGYFSVQAPGGVRYTRDGAFTLNAQRQIVTADGAPVLGTSGSPVTVPAGQVGINQQGIVTANGKSVGALQVTLLDPKSLKKQGDSLYNGTATNGSKGRVEQGYLEQANVNAVTEMVDLISTMRSFEASQKTTQAIDDTLGKAANDVGRL